MISYILKITVQKKLGCNASIKYGISKDEELKSKDEELKSKRKHNKAKR